MLTRRILYIAMVCAAVASMVLHAMGSPLYWSASLALMGIAVALVVLEWWRSS